SANWARERDVQGEQRAGGIHLDGGRFVVRCGTRFRRDLLVLRHGWSASNVGRTGRSECLRGDRGGSRGILCRLSKDAARRCQALANRGGCRMNAALAQLDSQKTSFLHGFGFEEIEVTRILDGGMFSRPVLLEADGRRYLLRTHSFRSTVEAFR